MLKNTTFVLCLLLLLAACQQTEPRPDAFAVTVPGDEGVLLATLETPTPGPTRTPSSTPATPIPPTMTPQDTAVPTEIPATATPAGPVRISHFLLERPISSQNVDYFDRTYAYGDTQQDNLPVHHGVDFANPQGTSVLAAADGVVYYAGDDGETLFGTMAFFYGNLVVIEHDFDTPEGATIYTLYGHLDRVTVEPGQRVAPGYRIGYVGGTGVAIGPHLHFEVRADNPHDYGATRNPDLWLKPYDRFGTLVGAVTNADGDFIPGVTIEVRGSGINTPRYAYTYASASVSSSPVWEENFTLGDLPRGEYDIFASQNGRVFFRNTVMIVAGDATWIDITLE